MKRKIFLGVCLSAFFPFHLLLGQNCSDSLASPETRALYRNLYKLIGKAILFGHQDDPCYGVAWKYQSGRSDVKEVVGEYPAIYGFDLGRIELGWTHNLDSVPFDKTRQFIQEAYERGAVVTLSWHLNNPLTGGTAWDHTPGAVASILPGGNMNALYTIWLDRVADYLNSLRGKNGEFIPIILRLFHELNGGWFWWGKDQCTPEEMIQCWRYTVHYLRSVKHIHHVLYAFNTDKFFSESEYIQRYPGDQVIDILGCDVYQGNTYKDNLSFAQFLNKDLSMLDNIAQAHHKIPALTEFGYNEIPDSTWWTKVFFPVIASHQIVYVLAWRNAGKKPDGSVEFYTPYTGAVSASDFKKMSATGKVLFENGINSKKIYQ